MFYDRNKRRLKCKVYPYLNVHFPILISDHRPDLFIGYVTFYETVRQVSENDAYDQPYLLRVPLLR
jgi:hypothetical protein